MRLLVDMEPTCQRLYSRQSKLVVQTENYMRALFRAWRPSLSQDQIDRDTEAEIMKEILWEQQNAAAMGPEQTRASCSISFVVITVGTAHHRNTRPDMNNELTGQDGFGHWRDSKNPEGPKLSFSHSSWLTFTTAISMATA